ncbi:hypothetical protein ABZ641_31315, partial [Kitasatospora sp. NPDC007106]
VHGEADTGPARAGGAQRTARAARHRAAPDRRHTDRLVATLLELPARSPAGPSSPTGSSTPVESTSLVESAADGWWYTAPLPTGGRLVAHFTDADLGPPPPGDRAAFDRLLGTTRYAAERAAAHPPGEGRPRRAPAHSSHLDTPTGDGWTAVGDAAAAFDPISSQGVLTALHTGTTAALAVHARLDGDTTALDAYRRNVDALVTAYRRNHRTAYAAERRWADRPFWRRRHAPTGHPPTGPPPTGHPPTGHPPTERTSA